MAMQRLNDGTAAYGRKWNKQRGAYLKRNPLCVFCKEAGYTTAADVVDHIKPHRGCPALFWDEANWQSLCKHHHDSAKQFEEVHGYSQATDEDGWPIDNAHPANRGKNA